MKKKQKNYGSDFVKLDAHVVQPDEYDEAPELTDDALDRGQFFDTIPLTQIAASVAQIRAKTEMTQKDFSETFGFPISTLRKWEQGTRVPTGAAMALLTIIDRNPDAALAALRQE